jgi:nucleoside-diphosphate-sugar epimerase
VIAAVDSNVLIFGAGSHARKVALACIERGHNVLGFVSSRPLIDVLDELPVYDLSALGDNQFV